MSNDIDRRRLKCSGCNKKLGMNEWGLHVLAHVYVRDRRLALAFLRDYIKNGFSLVEEGGEEKRSAKK